MVQEDQVKRIARAQARSSGKEEDLAIKQLFQKLGVLLVKGNASMLLNRIQSPTRNVQIICRVISTPSPLTLCDTVTI